MTMEQNLEHRNQTLRDVISILEQHLEDVGPCDHSVNICVCGIRNTYENLGSLFYRITSGQVGFAPAPQFIDLEQFTRNILGIKDPAHD